jgi:tetratricopeptide (TPR) repeat protein
MIPKRMSGMRLIRNGWFIGIIGLLYGTAAWGGFQWIYGAEIELERLARSVEAPDPDRVMRVHERIAASRVRRDDLEPFVKLGQVLERAGRGDVALEVWRRVVAVVPEDDGLRMRLALTLHNADRYEEAEPHFAALLREGSE